MSSLTFESLPNEIFIIIFQYFGDVCQVFRAFLGLNQRLNDVLLDKRSHLLTDFLCIHPRNDYYQSDIFRQIVQQLSTVKTAIDRDEVDRIFQPLIRFHIQQRYNELGEEFRLASSKFRSIREQFSDDERRELDRQLKIQFQTSTRTSTIDDIQRLISFVLRKGARLVCDDYELGEHNLAKAINQQLLIHIDNIQFHSLSMINLSVRLFKTLLISNTSLLNNRDYVGNGGSKVRFFLIYAINRLQSFYWGSRSSTVNMNCYRAVVELFLFVLQCYQQDSFDDNYARDNLFDMLEFLMKNSDNFYVRTTQLELIKILVDQYNMQDNQLWDGYTKIHFKSIIQQCFEKRQVDILKYIYSYGHFQEMLQDRSHIRACVNALTINRTERRFFSANLDHEMLNLLFPPHHLIFILIENKERTLLKKVLKLLPNLIDLLDEDGNDPLLYLSLKVKGCRHRIVEMLIQMGSNIERRNFQGQSFVETLQLKRNHQLHQQLIEHEII